MGIDMLRICAKGHYELAYNDINTMHEPLNCPACEAIKRLEELQDEMTRILDELAFDKAEIERLHDKGE